MRRFYAKDSITKEIYLAWVAPGSVRYNQEDISFLLPWLIAMRGGVYPAEPSGGYLEGKRTGISSHAFYEAACQVAAEIDSRLARTGADHYLVIDFYCNKLTDEDIAIKIFMPTREVRRRIKSAVSYIASGTCPRWLNCVDCVKYQTCRRKKRVGVTYREWTRYKNREEGRRPKYTNLV